MTVTYERVLVDPPLDANLGSVRCRGPETVAALRSARRGGVSMKDLARQAGVSVRTVYRWLADPEEDYLVDVDGWSAVFAVSPGQQPRRISPWQRRA